MSGFCILLKSLSDSTLDVYRTPEGKWVMGMQSHRAEIFETREQASAKLGELRSNPVLADVADRLDVCGIGLPTEVSAPPDGP